MLGLFGGRFDPPHRAHLAMAQAAADQLGLQEVRWIVTGQPVHKPAEASAAHRLAMTARALESLGDVRMRLDDGEVRAAELGQSSATYRTIERIQHDQGSRPLVWILGQDQFSHFTSWQHWDWLIRNMALAVCARPGAGECAEQAQLREQGAQILEVQIAPDEASSTWARQAIREGVLPEGLLPQVVADYIAEHRLYASDAK
ncbi:MAG: nicotinate (nicotinamide) nucleotide adenylyltransferase [Burkholderiaceae bacterium]